MSNRTRLNITPSIKEYAKSFGARFDKRLKEWYVEGSVPAELEELVCREIRSRDYVSEVSPSCPKCGNKMVFRSGANYQFWGCLIFPHNLVHHKSLLKPPVEADSVAAANAVDRPLVTNSQA
jgi:hypothetical protein